MTKLTDDDIRQIIAARFADTFCLPDDIAFARAIEDAVLERAALAAEKVQDNYNEMQGGKWPELRDDAATGAGDCASAIRAMKNQGE
jgi:hypothetical protein